MKILASFQRFFGLKPQASSPRATLRLLTDLQRCCASLPQGESEVVFTPGQLHLCLTWVPTDSEKQQPGLAFYLNGTDSTVHYADIPASKPSQQVSDSQEYETDTTPQSAPPASESPKPSKQQTVLQQLLSFLQLHYAFRYNRLTDQTECASLQEVSTPTAAHERKYQPVDNRLLNSISLAAMQAGVACWDRDVKRYLDSAEIPAYHPFTDYLEHLPQWDGTDRVTPLAQRVSSQERWVSNFHRWMLATVAQWMWTGDTHRHANSVAPILISTRQGMGKSTFCRNLLPESLRNYYTDSFDLNQPNSTVNKLAMFGLINLDEFDRIPTARMPQLKNLMQMEGLHLRRAYKTHGEPLPRIANFIATSNRRDLLTDLTGSRRFICVEVERFIDTDTPIAYDQLYAQLKEELLNGERSWFSKEEEAEIQAANRDFYRVSPAQEVLEGAFEWAQPEEEGAHLLSAAQLYAQLKRKNPAALRDCSPTAFSRLLAQMGTRVHTRYGNGYWVKSLLI